MIGAVGAGVVCLLGVLILAVSNGRDSGDPSTDAIPASANESSSTSSTSTSDDPSTETAATTAPITCWEGTVADSPASCPALLGVDGMRWVFPSLDRRFGSCSGAPIYDDKRTALQCDLTVDGSPARLVYSEFYTASNVWDHYRGKYADERPEGDRVRFGPQDEGDSWQVSLVYAAGRRFSVTAACSTPACAMDTLARATMRSESEMTAVIGARGLGH